jgi:hypothetical protein
MSTRITSVSHWFHCMGPTATLAERHAALARLIRMLVGDGSTRKRPPITLPGRPTLATPLPESAPAETVRMAPRVWGRATRERTIEPDDADAQDPYTREELMAMNARFVQRLARAIAHGLEQSASAPH